MKELLSPEEVARATELLRRIVADRGLLAGLPEEARAALYDAAGRVARPTRFEGARLGKELRERERLQAEQRDRAVRAVTQIREARLSPVYVPPAKLDLPPGDEGPELSRPRYCYVCKAEFRRLHFFYDSMCRACGDLNYQKRHQTASLAGRVALVTGARLKIGYQAGLMLLRAGAEVVVTTRFPRDAAARYRREPDFPAWGSRLRIHGLDLRHSPSVELFARYLDHALGRLDVLVNNAAQTVRRPPAFYAHLLQAEALPWEDLDPESRALLKDHEELKRSLSGAPARPVAADTTGLSTWHAGGPGIGLRASAELSQIKYSHEDAELGLDAFPPGETDADLQQIDLRDKNSWRLTLAEVSTAEMLELQLINSVAPFILCARLKALMLRERTGEKHIINVSAMEGSFSRRTKTDKHPHTNMAKAALNMLTLTSAPDYAKDGLFMNAVDTGWVTDEDPAKHAARKTAELDFQPPLDIVDGAARVLDPLFSGLLTGTHVWGQFLKDYKPTPW